MKISESFNTKEFDLVKLKLLFASDTYYSFIVKILIELLVNDNFNDSFSFDKIENNDHYGRKNINNFLDTNYFDWYLYEKFDKTGIDSLIDLLKMISKKYLSGDHDILKIIHQSILPKYSRYRTGEYYTPDWLVEYTLEASGYKGALSDRLLDPSCGSGSFLFFAVRQILKQNSEKIFDPQIILNLIYGYDLNPLAILTAKANLIIALRQFLPFENKIYFNITKYDLLNSDAGEQLEVFDYIVGNPPWLNWKSISESYKKKIIPIAEKYGLFNQKGLKARLGFAEDDISAIITYISIDRFLKNFGKLAFVLPQSLFQSIGGGEGFRRFNLLENNAEIKVERIIDFIKVTPFKSASNRTAVFIAEKGYENKYPVQYDIINKKENGISTYQNIEEFNSQTILVKGFAEPINCDDKCSPWIVTPDNKILGLLRGLMKESSYKARAGACTWMSGVYWVDVLHKNGNLTKISNNPGYGKIVMNKITREIESDLIFPLLRGRNLTRWNIQQSGNIILPQNIHSASKAITEEEMKLKYCRTYNYLMEFKELLLMRKGYRKLLFREPFYAIYDVGQYTFAPYKVGWRYLSKTMNAAVIYNNSQKPIIPDLNVITISPDSLEEAYYLSALLNSSLVQIIIRTFGECLRITPGIMKHLPIPRFNNTIFEHRKLAELGDNSHANFNNENLVKENENEIDRIYAYILQLSSNNLERLKDYLNETE
jgi:hypothetical protein